MDERRWEAETDPVRLMEALHARRLPVHELAMRVIVYFGGVPEVMDLGGDYYGQWEYWERFGQFWDALRTNTEPLVGARELYGQICDRSRPARQQEVCDFIRESVNPFGPACGAEWRTDTVSALARTIRGTGDYTLMPILADALQDAGCDADAVLSHCRQTERPHHPGCWVLALFAD
jgi:hypothetical protein